MVSRVAGVTRSTTGATTRGPHCLFRKVAGLRGTISTRSTFLLLSITLMKAALPSTRRRGVSTGQPAFGTGFGEATTGSARSFIPILIQVTTVTAAVATGCTACCVTELLRRPTSPCRLASSFRVVPHTTTP